MQVGSNFLCPLGLTLEAAYPHSPPYTFFAQDPDLGQVPGP